MPARLGWDTSTPMSTRAFIVGGTHSGCGKTLVSLGLMAACVRRGFTVQAFKAGPDFIDPGHHETVTGRPSHNLDGWMMGRDAVDDVFRRFAADADVAVVEGVMGLFDGYSGQDDAGSTAELAKWLGLPVVLVLDARSMARSVGALALGFASYDPDLTLAGALCNRVGSQRHKDLLFDALSGGPGSNPGQEIARPLGFLGRDEDLAVPSRHLGLVTAGDHALDTAAVDRLASWMEQGCNVGRVLALCPELNLEAGLEPGVDAAPSGVSPVIAVARDRAFCFTYHENLRLLEAAGARLEFFSPLADAAPPQADAVYLPGGYPELHAAELAANQGMVRGLRDLAASGGRIYAECGGFMYLMRSIVDASGREHPLCGVFDMSAAMDERFRALGYREVVTTGPSPFGPEWTMLRGHEFHYSHAVSRDPDATPVYKVMDRKGWLPESEGFIKGNVLGSYIHLHLASNPDAASAFVRWCAGT